VLAAQSYSQEPGTYRALKDAPGLVTSRAARGRQVWREYNLAPFTSRQTTPGRPEQAVVDWIIQETGDETWHGEEVTALSAGRGRLQVFHTPDVQDQVAEIVDRFVRPPQWQVIMKFEILSCSNLDWRSGLIHLLKPVATGPEGQHVWAVAPEDAALVRDRLRRTSQARALNRLSVAVTNGQTSNVDSAQPMSYISGLELASGAFTAYNPVIGRLNEGAKLRVTPLWTADGTAVDMRLVLTTRAVRKLHQAQSTAPLTTGNQNATVQVPEVSATMLDQSLRWPTSQVLLISAGVQPAMQDSKRSLLSLSGSAVELLVLGELDPPAAPRSTNSRTPAANGEGE
ncbi:MAG: hypothetical protein HY000_29010, partial [Planctomycetes bacterium]|nr:hypothetical protein [Planctomycetota bacterium]